MGFFFQICQDDFSPPYTLSDEDTTDIQTRTIISSNIEGCYTINPDTAVLGTAIDNDVDPDYQQSVTRYILSTPMLPG